MKKVSPNTLKSRREYERQIDKLTEELNHARLEINRWRQRYGKLVNQPKQEK